MNTAPLSVLLDNLLRDKVECHLVTMMSAFYPIPMT